MGWSQKKNDGCLGFVYLTEAQKTEFITQLTEKNYRTTGINFAIMDSRIIVVRVEKSRG